MSACPECGLPMAWSETHQRQWCSVYGDHMQPGRWREYVDEMTGRVAFRQNLDAPCAANVIAVDRLLREMGKAA